ncbi:hypothetical protein M427DRAFT_54339 [Gonapodya prolifera JEL478]|uniref:Uncharacterized protein n=1 Tax=Gonapodya prolifera (strain JEL478) TaxID=1344416 RepID=A0A139ALU3_GONPJ|nr:hypothetical protein M427DRAFT_54339 [Gonapodya prolifera JEL478]|eukprot:KXS17741.1 hypothetical protein M427DRAFT_54339 [Gonapodya prolifera JEL478]
MILILILLLIAAAPAPALEPIWLWHFPRRAPTLHYAHHSPSLPPHSRQVKRSFPSQSLEHLYAQNGVSWTSGDPSATWGAASSSGSGPGQPGSTVTMPGGTQHSLQQMSQEQIAMLLGFYGIPDA